MGAEQKLLCVGECMVELSAADGDAYRMGFAGDTFNTAWYARHLLPTSWSVGFASCVGTDAISDRMLGFMREAGIAVDTIRRLENRTVGLYMIQLDRGERSFSYWRGQSAAREMAGDPGALDDAFASASVVFYSGITLAILTDTSRKVFCEALSRARAQGVRTVFDTNMRARLWPDKDAMCAGIMQGATQADWVLPSFDEERDAFGDNSAAAVAGRYHRAGASLVVVKNAADPILVSRQGAEPFEIAPDPVAEIVDSTAAGDSFNAGFLAAYLGGVELEQAVRQGAELAAKVVQAPGALVEVG